MEVFLLYLWLKIDALKDVLDGASFILTLVWAGSWFLNAVGDGEVKRLGKAWIVAGVAALVINALIPNSKHTAALVAAHYAVKVADTPEAHKALEVLRKKANEYLDEQLSDKPAAK